MTFFKELIKSLGSDLGINLVPNEQDLCLIILKDKIHIQLKPATGNRILICSSLGALPPGAFRETLLRGALIANSIHPPLYGILSYSNTQNSLVLFEFLDSAELNTDTFIKYFHMFSKKAEQWMDTINSNTLPPIIKDAAGIKK